MSNRTANSSEQVPGTGEAFSYEMDDTETVTEAVLTAVTAVTGHTPVPIEDDTINSSELPPLYTVVDPEALESLFHPTRSGGCTAGYVRFHYANCVVIVESNGRILIQRQTDSPF